MIKSWAVNQKQFAEILRITPARVNQLITDNVLVLDDSNLLNLVENVGHFIDYKLHSETVDYKNEKALHEKAKRQLAEMELQKKRGEIYEAATIEQELADVIINFRTQMQGLGNKLAMRLQNRGAAEIATIINKEIEDNLLELSERFLKYADTENNSGGDPPREETENQ